MAREHLVQRHQRGLGVQRIEDGLQQDEIDPAFNQGLGCLAVGGAEGGEVDGALAGVVHVRGDREGLVRGAEYARDEAGPLGGGCGIGGLARDPGAGEIEGAHRADQAVVLLRHPVRVESVGGDDVGAGFEEARMDVADDLRPGEGEQVVVTGQLAVVIGIERAAKVRLAQLVALDHGAHGPVQQQYALRRGRFESGRARGLPAVTHRLLVLWPSAVASCRCHALPLWPAARKYPPRLKPGGPNALAAFVERPQAVAQIGAKAP